MNNNADLTPDVYYINCEESPPQLYKFILLLLYKITLITLGLLIEPSKPEELTVTKDGDIKTKVTLSWKAPNPPDPSITEYKVQYGKSGEDLKEKNSSACQCEVTGLTAATRYQFRVAAINSAGYGPFTDFATHITRSKFI